jgi:hypothetical protein
VVRYRAYGAGAAFDLVIPRRIIQRPWIGAVRAAGSECVMGRVEGECCNLPVCA